MPRAARNISLLTLAACFYNVGTIWMTHLNWRLWRFVGRDDFETYHRAWWFGWSGIKPVIFPMAILAALGSLAQIRWRPPHAPLTGVALEVLLQIATYVGTALWWGRWQGQLQQVRREDGSLDPFYEHIMRTHWLRVGLITAAGLVQLWLVGRDRLR